MSCGPALAIGRFIYTAARWKQLAWLETSLLLREIREMAKILPAQPRTRDDWYLYSFLYACQANVKASQMAMVAYCDAI
jgi:hypothetical protein